ncbi:membrane hypothetical protein [Candidatus Contendobacter odensis Run_B_J11]|uniref:DUF1345 domain-containing protein n=1 Tax=Candidatus Contendobacter odensis Run_B_J11 TaxID=1400861 RepID=A0A7U7J526_9GAMM|nr:membrane hypothetical protein [Candidatus Contendobacter odensis Run_B_J11]
MVQHPLHDLHWAARLSTLKRQGSAIVPALVVGITGAFSLHYTLEISILVAWCVYCAIVLSLTGLLALRMDAQATSRRAQWNDPGSFLLFILVIIAGCASLAAVTLAIDTGNTLQGWSRWGHLCVVSLSLVGAWLLIQTAFALHYARVYYRPSPSTNESAYGLVFPGDCKPDYLDFFYYSAVIGMTSQVSDVAVKSPRMRRLTLGHGLLSFWFNLIVLAIAINVLASRLI